MHLGRDGSSRSVSELNGLDLTGILIHWGSSVCAVHVHVHAQVAAWLRAVWCDARANPYPAIDESQLQPSCPAHGYKTIERCAPNLLTWFSINQDHESRIDNLTTIHFTGLIGVWLGNAYGQAVLHLSCCLLSNAVACAMSPAAYVTCANPFHQPSSVATTTRTRQTQ